MSNCTQVKRTAAPRSSGKARWGSGPQPAADNQVGAATTPGVTYDQILNTDHEFAPNVGQLTMDGPAPVMPGAPFAGPHGLAHGGQGQQQQVQPLHGHPPHPRQLLVEADRLQLMEEEADEDQQAAERLVVVQAAA